MKHRIAVIGLPFFGERTAAALQKARFDAHFVPRPGRSPGGWASVVRELARADLIYAIGSDVGRGSPLDLVARLRKPILLHWVGSHIRIAIDQYRSGRASLRVLRQATHWADAPWLVEQLRAIGVQAEERLLPVPAAIGAPAPLPAEFRVLMYAPAEFSEPYDIAGMLAVARSLPAIPFTIVGGYEPPRRIPHVELLGFVDDIAPVYRQSTILVRLAHCDGMAHSVIEALSFGRYVLWNYPAPGACLVSSPGEAIACIAQLADRFEAGQLPVNEEGARAVLEKYDPDKILDEVQSGLQRLLQ
jgi:hypothetical protein